MKKIYLLSKYDISDTCVYLAAILKCYGKKVVVLDETEQCYIKYFVNAEEETVETFEYQGIDYVFSKSQLNEIENADVVLINTNKRMMLPLIEREDEIFVFANQDRSELMNMKSYIEALGARGFVNVTRFLNIVDSKIDQEYISNFLATDNINVLEDHEIYFDEANIKTKIENTFNLRINFTNITSDYKSALMEMSSIIIGDELEDKKVVKLFKKAFKTAERGGKSAGLFSK